MMHNTSYRTRKPLTNKIYIKMGVITNSCCRSKTCDIYNYHQRGLLDPRRRIVKNISSKNQPSKYGNQDNKEYAASP
ncbi:hypothetical protein SAMN04487955_10556 [Halomonas korlensis]|uniref:Uncharacterized protein n=1 Tax=Halomonas korlensis TaxID=463301 RepID=A0A1I7HSE7_9GAMM|nr:hypothetical protein SAMN04487955_10556 [Halomonas korlensis]